MPVAPISSPSIRVSSLSLSLSYLYSVHLHLLLFNNNKSLRACFTSFPFCHVAFFFFSFIDSYIVIYIYILYMYIFLYYYYYYCHVTTTLLLLLLQRSSSSPFVPHFLFIEVPSFFQTVFSLSRSWALSNCPPAQPSPAQVERAHTLFRLSSLQVLSLLIFSSSFYGGMPPAVRNPAKSRQT